MVFFPVHAELKSVIRLKISPIETALYNPKVSFPPDENLQLLYRFPARQISGHAAMCKMRLLIAAKFFICKTQPHWWLPWAEFSWWPMLTPMALVWAGGECWVCYQHCTVHTSYRTNRFSSTELLILKPADGLQVAPSNRWEWGMRGEWAEHVGVIKQPNAKLPNCWNSWWFQLPQAMSGFGLEKLVVGWFRWEPVLVLDLEAAFFFFQ